MDWLMAFRRCVVYKGTPLEMRPDQGTNLKSERELHDAFKGMSLFLSDPNHLALCI